MRVLIVVLLVLLVLVLVTGENKVNSYSDQLKLGQVCKFGVEFDNNYYTTEALTLLLSPSLFINPMLSTQQSRFQPAFTPV